MPADLNAEEREALEQLIGIGLDELGRWPDDIEKAAALKLGLNPVGWHRTRWFDKEADRLASVNALRRSMGIPPVPVGGDQAPE